MTKYWLFDGEDIIGPLTPQDIMARDGFSESVLVCPEDASEEENAWQTAAHFSDFSTQVSRTDEKNILQAPDLSNWQVQKKKGVVSFQPRTISLTKIPLAVTSVPISRLEKGEMILPFGQSVPEVESKTVAALPQTAVKLSVVDEKPVSVSEPVVSVVKAAAPAADKKIVSTPAKVKPAISQPSAVAATPVKIQKKVVAEKLKTIAAPTEKKPAPVAASAKEIVKAPVASASSAKKVDSVSTNKKQEKPVEKTTTVASSASNLKTEFRPEFSLHSLPVLGIADSSASPISKGYVPFWNEVSSPAPLTTPAQSVAAEVPETHALSSEETIYEETVAVQTSSENISVPQESSENIISSQSALPDTAQARWGTPLLLLVGFLTVTFFLLAGTGCWFSHANQEATSQKTVAVAPAAAAPALKNTAVAKRPDIPVPPPPKVAAVSPLQEKALSIVKNHTLSGNRGTVEQYLKQRYASQLEQGYQASWSAEPLHKSTYIVKYRLNKTRLEPIVYVFQADTSSGKLTGALNNITLDLVGKI